MLSLSRQSWLEILAEAWRVYPLEACGLLMAESAGSGPSSFVQAGLDEPIKVFRPIHNAAQSSRIFQLDPKST
jgi:proteasome lid subunit RPN8/RPN11